MSEVEQKQTIGAKILEILIDKIFTLVFVTLIGGAFLYFVKTYLDHQKVKERMELLEADGRAYMNAIPPNYKRALDVYEECYDLAKDNGISTKRFTSLIDSCEIALKKNSPKSIKKKVEPNNRTSAKTGKSRNQTQENEEEGRKAVEVEYISFVLLVESKYSNAQFYIDSVLTAPSGTLLKKEFTVPKKSNPYHLKMDNGKTTCERSLKITSPNIQKLISCP